MTESELIAAAKAGDQDAFAELYRTHLRYVKAVGRAILRTNDLDDLCQDTFLLAFTRISIFHGNSNFRTWVTRIAMNRCLMTLRRHRQKENGDCNLVALDLGDDTDDVIDGMFSIEDSGLRSLPARLDIEQLLGRLDPRQRRAVTMAYLDGEDDRDVALMLGMNVPAVKSCLLRAKRKMSRIAHSRRFRRNQNLPPASV